MKNRLYSGLKSNKKKLIIRAIIMCFFLLAVNTYAWFIYIDKFDGNINANVIGWDVSFYDDGEDVNSVSLNIDELYPGMDDYSKNILVNNNSDMRASFTYEIEAFTLFGHIYSDGYTSNQLENILNSYFPFKINFSKNKDEINSGGDTASFTINASWDFESDLDYYKINNFYRYDENISYYIYNDGIYTLDASVTSANFDSKISTLYIESDEADTYWGTEASIYRSEHPALSCLTLQMNLIVTQSAIDIE